MKKLALSFIFAAAALMLAADFKTGLDAYNRGDFAAALKEWQPIAEQGDPNAQYNLGLLYARGQGVTQDYKKAIEWYQKAGDQGVAAAEYNLGVIYANGQGVPQNTEEAAKWFLKAANQGVADAESSLGTIYSEGAGAFKNYSEAEKWYRKAAGQGVASAAFSLGVMYDVGQGVPQNYEEALTWYRKAADAGYASAYTNLGILYYNAQGVKRDLIQAYAWFARAQKAGEPRAADLLTVTTQKMNAKQIKAAQAAVAEWHPSPKPQTEVAAANLFAPPPAQGSAERTGVIATAASPPAPGPQPPVPTSAAPGPQPPVPTSAAPGLHPPVPTSAAPGPQPPVPASAAPGPHPPVPASAAPGPHPTVPASAAPGPQPPVPTSAAPGPRPLAPASVWPAVDRIIAVGDVHGDYEQFTQVLASAGLIDGNGNWTGGKTHLVQTGDIVDRGPDSRAVIDLLMRLEKQAAEAGGGVHCLIGNHEAMDVYGDLRYVSPAEFAAFSTEHSDANRESSYARYHQAMTAAAKPELDRSQWIQEHPPGFSERREAFGPNGIYGQWIRSHNAAIKIGRTLFIHAGLGPKYQDWSLDQINDEVRRELNDFSSLHGGIVIDEQGPLWFGGLAKGDEAQLEALVDGLLKHFDADRIVIGHTYADAAVTPRFNSKVIMIDVGIPRVYDNLGKVACLEIDKNQTIALHRGQRLELPKDESGPDMLRYLRQAAALDPQPSPLLPRIAKLEQK